MRSVWKRWFIFAGFLLAWAFTVYFVGVISIAFFSGRETVIFHFNIFNEFWWEYPLFMVVMIVSTLAFLLMFKQYGRGG